MAVKDTACVVSTILFLILILVACATIVPQVFLIEENTDNLNVGHVVINELNILHGDIEFMQEELTIFAGELVKMNTSLWEMNDNIDILVNGKKRMDDFTIKFAHTSARFMNLMGKVAVQ